MASIVRDDGKLWVKFAFGLLVYGIPVLLIIAFIFLLRHRQTFGGATLILTKFPLRLGDEIVGEVHTDKPLRPLTPVNIRLKCIRRRACRHGSIDRTLFEYQHQIQPDVFRPSETSTIIPVRVEISERGEKTSVSWLGTEILWFLEIEAKSEKPRFDATFTIPVLPQQSHSRSHR